MRASKEIRRFINRLRRRRSGRNGVVCAALFDIPWLERQEATDAKMRRRRKAMMRHNLLLDT